MLDAVFGFVFDTVCYGVGRAFLWTVTLGRYQPPREQNPYLIASVGLIVILTGIAGVAWFLEWTPTRQ